MAAAGEALDDYLVWELCKQRDIQRIILEESPDGEALQDGLIEEVRQTYREHDYERREKLELLRELDSNPDHRSRIFEGCSWRRETVSIADLGTTLPRAGDLPPEVIAGPLPEVVDFVRQADPAEYRSVKYIRGLTDVPAVLDAFLPWVISPGSRIRERERMNREHGERDWDIAETWGALNDGNHRTIATILATDAEAIECYVGRPEV